VKRKRGKKHKAAVAAIPEDILAEGSGPVGRAEADPIATVEDVVTTDDIATTEDVVTADDVVATPAGPEASADDAGACSDEDGDRDGLEPARDRARVPEDGGADRCAPGEIAPDLAIAADEATMAAEPGGDADDGDLRADAADRGDAGEPGSGEPADPGDPGDGDGDGHDDDDAAIVFPTSAATMDAVQLKHLVEALIFASDRPLTVPRLRQLTRVGDVRRLEQALAELSEDFRERGLVLQQVSGGYQFRTRTQFSAWVQQLIEGRPVRLSRAQLETLAIIAYRQPITRPEIDDIRGVDSSATLKLLIDRMLIRVLGKREEVGRPMLYGTTKEFLDFFSLGDLRELPTLREYSELTAESRKVMSDRLGIGPDGPDGDNGPDGGDDGDGSGGSDGSGGDSGGGGGAGGDGGPPPGFDDGGGTISDDGGAPASASELEVAVLAASDPDRPALIDEDGCVDSDAGWPSGSQRFTVIASIDDRPVERGVMDCNAIEAGALALEDSPGEPAIAAALHVEPAAE
jgi:segregation and condensation protein B